MAHLCRPGTTRLACPCPLLPGSSPSVSMCARPIRDWYNSAAASDSRNRRSPRASRCPTAVRRLHGCVVAAALPTRFAAATVRACALPDRPARELASCPTCARQRGSAFRSGWQRGAAAGTTSMCRRGSAGQASRYRSPLSRHTRLGPHA